MGVPSALSPGPSPSVSSSSRSSLQLPSTPPPEYSADDGYFGVSGGPSSGCGTGTRSIYPQYRAWRSLDPRTSSTQSLAPSLASQEQRRTLLVIYIHGFMGNDSSFRSFPAHIHQFLKESLAETHVIHSKIYPRYKTYKSIEVARDNFSLWLEPHESPTTDFVLVGHSMGGLLAADVALQPAQQGTYGGSSLRHRILGTVSLDAPLLGLHPGIVVSGIASLFRPAATPGGAVAGKSEFANPGSQNSLSPDPSIYSEIAPPSEASSPALTQTSSHQQSPGPSNPDPYYNPSFFNDVAFVDRGWFKNIAHFAKKHRQEGLVEAAASHIMSHLEFGGCLADYPGLKSRYNRLRKLEDADDLVPLANGERAVRVRFVNYYTVSTGPLKKAKSELPDALLRPGEGSRGKQAASESKSLDFASRPSTPALSAAGTLTPRISIEDHSDSRRPMMLQEIEPIPEPDELVLDEPTPTDRDSIYMSADEKITQNTKEDDANDINPEQEPELNTPDDLPLPAIPDIPPPPPTLDLSLYPDKDSRKQAEKEAKRAQKAYDQAIKSRDKAIKERAKLVEKRRRKTLKDAEKQLKLDEKKRIKEEKEKQKKDNAKDAETVKEEEQDGEKDQDGELGDYHRRRNQDHQEQELYTAMENTRIREEELEDQRQTDARKVKEKEKERKKKKQQKLRKFCMLPPAAGKTTSSGSSCDPTWVEVYMEGVDEVGAHCGLFFPGPHYERLIGDVGSRIVGWVQEDCSRRAVFDLD